MATKIVAARRDLSIAWRFFGSLGFTDTVFNHISTGVRENGRQFFLVNPANRFAIDCRAEDFLLYSVSERHDRSNKVVNNAAVRLHRALHRRSGIDLSIIHLHSPGAMALAASGERLLPLNQISMEFVDRIAYVPYRGLIEEACEADRIVRCVAGREVALLAYHGLLVMAPSVAEAAYVAYYVERACEIQVGLAVRRRLSPWTRCAQEQLRAARKDVVPLFWQGVRRRVRASSRAGVSR